MDMSSKRRIWVWSVVGSLCALLVAGGPYGEDCRTRIPNGHRIPFQQRVEGVCTGRNRGSTDPPFCHGGAVTVEENPFGKDFAAAGFKWTNQLCVQDSDGDGLSNGQELGDPCCVWREDAEVPQWMRDWHVSHPGFANSTQKPTSSNAGASKMCKEVRALKPKSFHDKGEKKISLEYELEPFSFGDESKKKDGDVVLFHYQSYNLPDDFSYDVVGLERWFETEEFTDYLVKHEVSFCSEKFEYEGENTVLDPFDDRCLEKVYLWRAGSASNFFLPKSMGLRAGKGTRRISFTSRFVYVQPPSDTNLTMVKTGLRFHITKSKRKHQLGVIRADFLMKTEVVLPDTMTIMSNLFQIEVDHSIAPKGVKVVGYLPGASQHFHLCKTWFEKLKRTSGREDQLSRLTELETAQDLGRDVEWFNEGSDIRLKDADYLSTTCLYNSTNSAFSIELEHCHSSLYYYPIEAVNYVLGYTGPVYINSLTNEQAFHFSSVTDIFTLPDFNTQLPLWRQLYLSGTYRCNPQFSLGLANTTEETYGVSSKLFQLRAPCRRGEGLGNFEVTEGRLAFKCSEECALIQFNVMGCMFLKDGMRDDGKLYSLFPAPMEAIGTVLCGAETERKLASTALGLIGVSSVYHDQILQYKSQFFNETSAECSLIAVQQEFQKIYEEYVAGLNGDLAAAYGIFGSSYNAANPNAELQISLFSFLMLAMYIATL